MKWNSTNTFDEPHPIYSLEQSSSWHVCHFWIHYMEPTECIRLNTFEYIKHSHVLWAYLDQCQFAYHYMREINRILLSLSSWRTTSTGVQNERILQVNNVTQSVTWTHPSSFHSYVTSFAWEITYWSSGSPFLLFCLLIIEDMSRRSFSNAIQLLSNCHLSTFHFENYPINV